MITKKQRTALHEPASVTFVGLVAGTAVGSTDTAILRWITAAQTVVGAYFTVTDSATLGTTILIATPGHYVATVMLPQVASTSLLMGMSLGGTTTPRTANPALGTNGVFATSGPHTLAAATAMGQVLCVPFDLLDSQIDGTNNLFRFWATNNAAGSPEPSITEAGAWARIVRCGDLGG